MRFHTVSRKCFFVYFLHKKSLHIARVCVYITLAGAQNRLHVSYTFCKLTLHVNYTVCKLTLHVNYTVCKLTVCKLTLYVITQQFVLGSAAGHAAWLQHPVQVQVVCPPSLLSAASNIPTLTSAVPHCDVLLRFG
jgi:hypothetical protein